MPHSYVSDLMHCVFSTKKRLPFITPELESRLWPYIGGIARENEMKAIAVGRNRGSRTCIVVFAVDDRECVKTRVRTRSGSDGILRIPRNLMIR